ncbi:hypothetical protein GCM10023261_13070 [Bartonella jaculi]|uniref:Uncharacterized protein n=1 Tax=Bartonella jaculi TaxID=686226 RepID=A0ABP9N966_9HYPH
MVLFLSNASPIFSANIDLTKTSLKSVKNAAVVYLQSTLSAYDNYNSGMESYNSVISILTTDGRFAWEDAQNIFTAGATVISESRRNKKTKNARVKNAVILDREKYTAKEKSVAIDSMAGALGLGSIAIDCGYDNQDDIEEYTSANGYSSRARTDGKRAVTIRSKAETQAYGNVILGS